MNRLQLACNVFGRFGPRIVWLRAQGKLKKALGWDRRQFRPVPWSQINLRSICRSEVPADDYASFKRSQTLKFLFPLGKPPAECRQFSNQFSRQPGLSQRLKLLAENRCISFFRTPSPEIPGAKCPDHLWHASEKAWFDISDFAIDQGDIRTLWEPSRAAWALDLARARARAIEVDGAALYWRWVDSWMRCCPPWLGPQWKCGQEAAVRFLALSIGFWSFADDPATTPERFVQLARLAWATGYRIDKHINYARSQKNNHALSEACGLLLIGHLFPEFREANQWFNRGRTIFCDELSRQVYADGSYLQNSMNYHRVMLQMATMAALLAGWHGCPFGSDTLERIARAEEFLFHMLDKETGKPPLYGNNDGAWVLPLDECDANDMRPAVQAAHYLTTGRKRFSAGPWDEDLLWLFGPPALNAPEDAASSPASSAFSDGGYYTLRGSDSWGMVRCHTYRDRPGHYDQLHFDLWWRGQNVLHDAGTYQYFPVEGTACEDYFQLSKSHNVVEVDAAAPVERVSRFLYFPWPKGRLRHFETSAGGPAQFEGEHFDYARPPWQVVCRRAIVQLNGQVWLIVDDVLGAGNHSATLRWHLPDVPVHWNEQDRSIAMITPAGACYLTLPGEGASPCGKVSIVRGETNGQTFQAVAAPYYGQLEPNTTVEIAIDGPLPLRLITIFAGNTRATFMPSDKMGQTDGFKLEWENSSWLVQLATPDQKADRIVEKITSSQPT